jgi:hypothetical protein
MIQPCRVSNPVIIKKESSPFGFDSIFTFDNSVPALFLAAFEIHKSVSNSALCKNVLRVGGILLQFLAEVIYVESNVMRFVTIFITPYLLEELVM